MLTDGTLKYVYGLGLAYAVDGSNNVQVYHTDGLGSVRAITDANGNLLATYSTDEFGIPTQTQGSSTQPFGFTGQQNDPESGLYDLRARMYDPTIGRFLSRDSVFGSPSSPLSLNRFSYVQNNPMTMMDPSGLALVLDDSYRKTGHVEFGGSSAGGSDGNSPERADCSASDPTNLTYLACPEARVPLAGGAGFLRIPNITRALWDWLKGKVEAEEQVAPAPSSQRGLGPEGVLPPGHSAEWTTGPASRESAARAGGQSYYDPAGGEWRYHPEDKYHPEPHWDYNSHQGRNSPWQNVPLN